MVFIQKSGFYTKKAFSISKKVFFSKMCVLLEKTRILVILKDFKGGNKAVGKKYFGKIMCASASNISTKPIMCS